MKKVIFKNIGRSFLFSILYLAAGFLLSFPISNYFQANQKDVVSIEGIIIIVISLFFSARGNPSGLNLNGFGNALSDSISYQNLEATRMERDSTDYYKNFTKHSIMELTFNSITMILGGALLILCSYLPF